MGEKYEDRIVQIMPCPKPMVVCYWVPEETDEVFREVVAFLALMETDCAGIYSNVCPMVMGEFEFCDASGIDNFLGLEYEGEKKDWTVGIKYQKERAERVKAKKR